MSAVRYIKLLPSCQSRGCLTEDVRTTCMRTIAGLVCRRIRNGLDSTGQKEISGSFANAAWWCIFQTVIPGDKWQSINHTSKIDSSFPESMRRWKAELQAAVARLHPVWRFVTCEKIQQFVFMFEHVRTSTRKYWMAFC